MNSFRSAQRTLALALPALLAVIPTAAHGQIGRVAIGSPFPDDRFPALKDGRPASITNFRGKRVLLLVFASW